MPRVVVVGARRSHPRLASILLASAAAVACAAGCKRTDMASTAQCGRLLDRFIDLELSEDPAARTMTSEDRARLRAKIATDVLSDADVKQVKYRCRTEVTEGEYECAVKAPTSRAWNDCIR